MLRRILFQGSRPSGFLAAAPALSGRPCHARLTTAARLLCQQEAAGRPAQSRASPPSAPPRPGRGGGSRQGGASQRQYQRKSAAHGKPVGKQRLNKALASAGVASRRGADALVQEGRVVVNGEVAEGPWLEVDLSSDQVLVDGRRITAGLAARKYYFAVNKPKGYICSNAATGDGSFDRRVVDLFADWQRGWRDRQPKGSIPPRLFTVGRLDVASVGLIFVTNDGDWAQQVMHPSSNITKEYSVTLNKRPTRAQLEAIATGCLVDGSFVVPVAVAQDDTDAGRSNRLRVVVSEGRNREVRTLVEAAGLEVTGLRRLRIGGYRLPRDLPFGGFRELKPNEARRVLDVGADRSS